MFIRSAKIVRASKRRETFNTGCCSTLCVPRVCISALYFSPCWRMPRDAKTWKNCRLEINHFSERARMCSDMNDEAQGWHRNFSQFRPPTIQTISICISTISVICTLLMDIELIIGISFSLTGCEHSLVASYSKYLNKDCLHLVSLIIGGTILRTVVKSNRKFSVLNMYILLFMGEKKFDCDNTFLQHK